MKIAVSSTGSGIDSPVENRFGRCNYFVIIDENGNHLETIENEAKNSPHGAGIAAAQSIINSGAGAVLTGKIGPKALQPLQSAGIKVYVGVDGNISQALEKFKQGKYELAG